MVCCSTEIAEWCESKIRERGDVDDRSLRDDTGDVNQIRLPGWQSSAVRGAQRLGWESCQKTERLVSQSLRMLSPVWQ